MTVLIVDDSPLIIARIIELLEDVDVITDLKTCGTYHHAIKLLNSYTPRVILLDINLPDRNGIEILQYAKAFFPETIIIMVTNNCSKHYRDLCFKMGADDFIDKSSDFEDIPAILSSVAS
jgi:DNA-binding NarL/FixJ family response regulator